MERVLETTGLQGRAGEGLGVRTPHRVNLLGRPFARQFLPDLALAAAFVTLFYCLFLFDGSRKLFRDSDTGWHIRTGEAILEHRALPRIDPYSFSRQGQPWFAWEWGSDVLMGTAYRLDGLRGVVFFYLLAIAAATWFWFRLHWAVGGNFLLACWMASPMLSTVNLHWLARPHVLGWLLLLAAVWYAETAPDRFRARHALTIIAFTALWANVHASFFLAPAIGAIYAAGHLVRLLLWNLVAEPERKKARWFFYASICALLGSLLNPYGWKLHLHLFQYLRDGDLLARVGEFQSFNFHAEGALQILLAIGLAAVGGVLALGQKKVSHFLLSALLIGVALRSARGLPVMALVLLPLANGAITASLRRGDGLRPFIRRKLDSFLAYSDNLRAIDVRLRGAALVPLAALVALGCLHIPAVEARTGFPPDQFPVKAADAVAALPPDARLLAPDMYGGYLIYRFQGRRKVFFDGRSDFYGSEFMKNYIRLVQVRPGWQDLLRSYGFTHALLPDDYSLLAALEQAGWKRLYHDEAATLVVKP